MLSREKIVEYLKILGENLEKQGLKGEILLVGGAAMCLIHSARDATKDIDALYEPKDIINHIASKIAEQESLPENWLNDSVKGFVGKNAPIEEFIELKGLNVQTVSAEYLLAMKLMSARHGEKDHEDICFLFQKLGITKVNEAFNIVQEYFPDNRIPPKTQYVIEEIIASGNIIRKFD
jgi:hypothetical protein